MTRANPCYDVAILGSGLASATLATVLARHGFSVLMLEAGSHPRFAIGESVVPEFGALAQVMADYFQVPELAHLRTFQQVRHHVSASCGIKRNFSFLSHTDDAEPRAEDWCQFQTMTYPFGPDSHIYRPDLDAWLMVLAVKYGAVYRERVSVEDVELSDDGVTIHAKGETFRARFLADGSGFRSVMANKLGLREPPSFATNTRTIFTHMVGVGGVEAAWQNGNGRRVPVPSPPDQGTLHHLFDGGWFWVIPFGNHENALNPVCSVGLTLDRTRFPDTPDLGAEEEFRSFVSRFPTVERQLNGARPIRSWVKTGRIQYQSTRSAGDRWCLLPHSASFLDPLFSGGMVLTLIGVRDIAATLMDILREDRFDSAAFAHVEEGSRENLAVLDKVIHGAYLAFRSPELFNAWYRFWAVGNYHGSAAMIRLHMKYAERGQRDVLELIHQQPYRRSLGTDQPRVRQLIEDGYALMKTLEDGRSEAEVTDELFALLAKQDWIPPQFHIAQRRRRHLASFTVFPLLAMIFWGKLYAPSDMKRVYYDVGPNFFWELSKSILGEGWRGFTSFWRVFMGAHFTRVRG